MESTGECENLGKKVVCRGKMCRIFCAVNNFGTAQFFVIDAWKYIFSAIILIHVAFIHKIEVF